MVNVSCLRCDREFESEDRKKNRICPICKRSDSWMNGEARLSRFTSTIKIGDKTKSKRAFVGTICNHRKKKCS